MVSSFPGLCPKRRDPAFGRVYTLAGIIQNAVWECNKIIRKIIDKLYPAFLFPKSAPKGHTHFGIPISELSCEKV
jgi:hypothetical protein